MKLSENHWLALGALVGIAFLFLPKKAQSAAQSIASSANALNKVTQSAGSNISDNFVDATGNSMGVEQ